VERLRATLRGWGGAADVVLRSYAYLGRMIGDGAVAPAMLRQV
jgi:hypothetical protein